jgi:hypothetical protein
MYFNSRAKTPFRVIYGTLLWQSRELLQGAVRVAVNIEYYYDDKRIGFSYWLREK